MPKYMPVNPKILKWARETAGFDIVDKLKIFPKLEDWENGISQPTYSQLERLALSYKRPIAVFFFSNSPKETQTEKSLRAIYEGDFLKLKPNMRFLFRKAQAFQLYLKELYSEQCNVQINKIKWLNQDLKMPVTALARKIRTILNVSVETQNSWKNVDQALEEWRKILTENGIYIFKDGFKDDRISGFCIYDELFPIIFLNNSLSKSRQIFTMFHELAHLIFRDSYLDIFIENYPSQEKHSSNNIEFICNNFAGDFLVPDEAFINQIPKSPISDNDIVSIANYYKISREVILRKLLNYKVIDINIYKDKIESWKADYKKIEDSKKNKKIIVQYAPKNLSYLGTQYFGLVLEKYYQGKIGIEKASEYLDIKAKYFTDLEETYLKKVVK